MENIAYLCSLRESPEWGEGGWKKIVICIISDRNKINKRTLSYLKALGVYQDGFEKSKVNNQTKVIIPAQILFCLQEKSKEKIDSHKWFFNAFCPILNPRICIFLKVGIKPGEKVLFNT
ncbi:Glycosyltransferase Family 2 protein [Gigaspora rosea]|uniref:Chitin synthase n=1 Tax=Gigaspora rosea TaxID=44941 RepID=A0A397W1I3_9GLOM|nr:Glycosyltransferase Family 2 protein [Gigaspora rosea]